MEINLLSEESRRTMAQRLRHVADNLERGRITPDSFSFEPEWIDRIPEKSGLKRRHPSGRVVLNLAYWTTPIDSLPE